MSLSAQAYPVADICTVVGLARNTFYHAQPGKDERSLREALTTLAGEYPTYGYHRLTALLGRQGWEREPQAYSTADAADGLAAPSEKAQNAHDQ